MWICLNHIDTIKVTVGCNKNTVSGETVLFRPDNLYDLYRANGKSGIVFVFYFFRSSQSSKFTNMYSYIMY